MLIMLTMMIVMMIAMMTMRDSEAVSLLWRAGEKNGVTERQDQNNRVL